MGLFHTTRWSLILAAREPGGAARDALEHLCRIYRHPAEVYVRRHVASPEDAADLTQAFFLKFLEARYHADADPNRGRFRAFLLTALKRFLANAHDAAFAQKRGGGAATQALDERIEADLADDPRATPEREFERAFALTVLGEAMRKLQRECEQSGKGALFASLQEFLIEAPEADAYGALAERLVMRRNTLAQSVKRMRDRLGVLVRAELAETVANPRDIDGEMRLLRAALAGEDSHG